MTNPIDYSCHGLTVRSAIALDEAYPGDETTPDVHISIAKVPARLDNPGIEGAFFQATQDTYLLNVPGVAQYLVRNGNSISVAPLTEAASVRHFVYGAPMAALLVQRRKLVLQGSAVRTPRGALLVLGQPASGKSVVAAALHKAGYPLIADDLCAVDSSTSDLLPGPRFHWLWRHDVEHLQMAGPAAQIRPGVDRYVVPLTPNSADPVPIFAICVLDPWNEETVRAVPMAGAAKPLSLIGNLYHRTMLEMCFNPLEHLQRVSALSGTECYRIWCPRYNRSLDDTVNEIREALGI